MRYRYLIERATAPGMVYVSTIEANGDAREIGSLGEFDNVADAKLAAEEDAARSHEELRWKEAPKSWQPDALYVSQTLDDGIESR